MFFLIEDSWVDASNLVDDISTTLNPTSIIQMLKILMGGWNF